MKRILTIIICIILMWLMSFPIMACTFTNDDIPNSTPQTSIKDIEEIKNHKDYISEEDASKGLQYILLENGNYSVAIGCCAEKDIKIPSLYKGKRVEIVDGFSYANINTVVIGYGIITLGRSAFSRCSSLTSVTIPNSVTTIESMAFEICSLKSIIIPNSVTSIGSYAFYKCNSLDLITLPDTLTNIGYHAFFETAYYENIDNWENDSLYIGNNLIRVTHESSGNYIIKDETTCIAEGALNSGYVESITSISIPTSVKSIGADNFDISALMEIIVEADNENYKSIDGVLYTKDGKTLTKYPQSKTDATFVMPNTVETIQDNAFDDAEFKSIILSKFLVNIGDYAFYGCNSLTSIEIPNSVTSIGEAAFSYCGNLKNINVGDNITNIGLNAFANTEFTRNTANYENELLYLNKYLIGYKGNALSIDTIDIKNGTKVIADDALFGYFNLFTSVNLPSSIKIIGDSAFYGCSKLKTISGGAGVEIIGDFAFADCETLSSVPAFNNVISIGDFSFYDCEQLVNISFGNKLKNIGEGAFWCCTSLNSITINSSVEFIGDQAFGFCTSLSKIDVDTNNLYYKSIDGNLYSKDGKKLIQYAIGKSNTNFTIPNNVTSIHGYAFYDSKSLQNIVIPHNVTNIGDYAFGDCSSLTSVTIENGVETIGDDAFHGCESITEIIIPESVESIGSYMLNGCFSLTSIKFNGSLEDWNNVSKGEAWWFRIPAKIVVCSDGEIAIKE